MTSTTRRLPFLALAAALLASVAVGPALAQSSNTPAAPGSRTPLSNESVPTPRTGDVATTRVGPSGQTARSQRHRTHRPVRTARRSSTRAPAASSTDTGVTPR